MSGMMGKGGGGGGTHTTTVENTLPEWLTTPYQSAVGDASSIYQSGGSEYFPEAGYVPHSVQSLTGLRSMEGLSLDPSLIPGYANTLDTFNRTVGGDYLHGGEGFNAALEAAGREIQPMVKSAFNQHGRTGGGLAQAAMTEELGDVFAGLYNAERGRQQGAMAAAPLMYDYALQPARTMMGVGSALEGKEGEALMDEMLRWQAEQPSAALGQYLTQLGSVAPFFSQQSQSQPIYESGGSGLLGSLMGLGSMFMGGPTALGGMGLGMPSGAGFALGPGSMGPAFNMFP